MVLADAAKAAGVRVFAPSEFGTRYSPADPDLVRSSLNFSLGDATEVYPGVPISRSTCASGRTTRVPPHPPRDSRNATSLSSLASASAPHANLEPFWSTGLSGSRYRHLKLCGPHRELVGNGKVAIRNGLDEQRSVEQASRDGSVFEGDALVLEGYSPRIFVRSKLMIRFIRETGL